jgi:osmoprotectant transport system ATP-binding protein
VAELGLLARAFVEPQATLSDALEEMLLGSAGVAIVVDGRRRFHGIVDVDTVTHAIRVMRDTSHDFYRAAKLTDPDAVAG